MARSMQLINTCREPDTHEVAKARFVACRNVKWLAETGIVEPTRDKSRTEISYARPSLC